MGWTLAAFFGVVSGLGGTVATFPEEAAPSTTRSILATAAGVTLGGAAGGKLMSRVFSKQWSPRAAFRRLFSERKDLPEPYFEWRRTFLNRLRALSIVEGISTIVLFFVAMPLKYVYDMPLAVTIVGSVHGGLFVALVVMFLLGRQRVPLSNGLTAAGILGAIVPFGPFVVERRLREI